MALGKINCQGQGQPSERRAASGRRLVSSLFIKTRAKVDLRRYCGALFQKATHMLQKNIGFRFLSDWLFIEKIH